LFSRRGGEKSVTHSIELIRQAETRREREEEEIMNIRKKATHKTGRESKIHVKSGER
jgi:hypothetical protein